MKTLEHGSKFSWVNTILNTWPFVLDMESIKSISIAWLFKEDGKWIYRPRMTGDKSLFFNAIFFLRLSSPFGIFFSFRWRESSIAKAIFQTGIGWKLNGRITITLRVQSDKASAAGDSGQNTGQAQGFEYGTH